MKRLVRKVKVPQLLVGLLLSLSLLTGCAGAPAQNPYMLSGAGLGAATGAALGIAANHRNPWKGAAIGGLLGGVLGGVGGEVYGRTVNPPPYYQPPAPNYSQPPAGYSAPPQGYSYARPAPYYSNY
jgi:hypothetical protein